METTVLINQVKFIKANISKYFEGLLESNESQPLEYNDCLNNLPSKKQLTEADLKASKLYNVQIRDTILQNIKIVILLTGLSIYQIPNFHHSSNITYMLQNDN